MDSISRKNDVAALIGFAPLTRGFAPWNDSKIDIWGLNEENSFSWWKAPEDAITGWFQIHPEHSFRRKDNHNDPKHLEWLQKKHPFPIIMQDTYPDIPSSVKYPWAEIRAKYGTYFSSSFTFALIYLYELGYKRIELYGFEMASDAEYSHQRPNACYWIGKLRGWGVDIYVPPASKLLTGVPYAYEDNMLGLRQDLEGTGAKLYTEMHEAKAEIQAANGRLKFLQEYSEKYPDLKLLIKDASMDIRKLEAKINNLDGRSKGISYSMKLFDTFYNMEMENKYGSD